MGDLIQIQVAGDIAPESEDAALLSVTNKLLLDDRLSVLNEKTMSVPIAELGNAWSGSILPYSSVEYGYYNHNTCDQWTLSYRKPSNWRCPEDGKKWKCMGCDDKSNRWVKDGPAC